MKLKMPSTALKTSNFSLNPKSLNHFIMKNIKKINFLIFSLSIFLFFTACNTHKEYTIPQKYIFIKYKDFNNIGVPAIKSAINNYLEAFSDGQLTSEIRNDTTFYKEVKVKGMTPWKPWRYESRFKTSKLQCPKKLRIDVERLSFYFCLEDVRELASKFSRNKDTHIAKVFKSLKDDLADIEKEYDKKADDYNFADGYFLSKAVRNINFEIKDSAGEHITEVRIGDVDVGWSTLDEIYLFNSQKDTVAATFNTYLMR